MMRLARRIARRYRWYPRRWRHFSQGL